ncbi:patatin-like phospholipase family protein [Mycoplasmatota bacterium WC30]
MKLGLCFTGGGARGAYQIGACMALKEAGILDKVEYFAGTSIGAANAALVASIPLEEVKNIWFNMPDDILYSTENFFKRLTKEKTSIIKNGLFTIESLLKVLKKHLDIQTLLQKKVFVTLSRVGSDGDGLLSLIASSYKHYFKHDRQVIYSPLWEQSENHIYKQIIASCSIPVVFPLQRMDGQQFADGGVYDNVPVLPLVGSGCDTVIVIHLDRLPYFYKKHYPNVKFHSIKSRHSLGSILKFEDKQSVTRYEMGYNDCKKYLETNEIL